MEGPIASKASLVICEWIGSCGAVDGFMCFTMSHRSVQDTAWNLSKVAVEMGNWGEVSDTTGVNCALMWSIFSIKNFKNSSQLLVEASTSGETWGFTIEFMVLNRILGRLECLLMMSEKCLALAFFAAAWKLDSEFLNISRETRR